MSSSAIPIIKGGDGFAPSYSSGTTYQIDTVVIKDLNTYQANQITSTGFTASQWDKVDDNASCLNGFSGTSYLRSDVADVKTAGNLRFNDGICATFGDSDDLKIYHDGTNSCINNATGELNLGVNVSEIGVKLVPNGATTLRYNNVFKFGTTSVGACTNGVHCATSCFLSNIVCANSALCAGSLVCANEHRGASFCATNGFIDCNGGTGYRFRSATGCGCAVNWNSTSDCRKKKCIEPYECGLDKVNELNPVYYQWKHDDTEDVGFIAQDVQKVEPILVGGNEEDGYGLNYGKFSALVVKAVQELSTKMDSQQENIERLQNRITQLENLNKQK